MVVMVNAQGLQERCAPLSAGTLIEKVLLQGPNDFYFYFYFYFIFIFIFIFIFLFLIFAKVRGYYGHDSSKSSNSGLHLSCSRSARPRQHPTRELGMDHP